MPKIHKAEVPLRPIVSAVNSPTYRLSKELARILTPLAGHTESHVNNSAHFAQKIQDTILEEDDVMVSFDVISLFTRVLVDKGIDVINSKICYLTKTCLQTTYFQFQDSFHEQVEGASMGSPLSPVVANLYMEAFKERALSTNILRPRKWK